MSGFGSTCLEFHSVSSTMDVGREYARRGGIHGLLITTSTQTNGRGRRGSTWQDEPASSALMTFILRPNLALAESWRLPFFVSLASAQALEELGLEEIQIKWPNDLVVRGHKIGGILVEMVSGLNCVYLAGIGINVNQRFFADAEGFALPPTSIALEVDEGKTKPSVRQIVLQIATELTNSDRNKLISSDSLISEWRKFQMTGHVQRGRLIDTGEAVIGTFRNVSEKGFGLVEVEQGRIVEVMPDYGDSAD